MQPASSRRPQSRPQRRPDAEECEKHLSGESSNLERAIERTKGRNAGRCKIAYFTKIRDRTLLSATYVTPVARPGAALSFLRHVPRNWPWRRERHRELPGRCWG